MCPAWSHALTSLVPSDSSTRWPQTNKAARTLRDSIAFRIFEFASGHFISESRLTDGSSIVRATCGREPFAIEFDGMPCEKENDLSADEKSGGHAATELILREEERN